MCPPHRSRVRSALPDPSPTQMATVTGRGDGRGHFPFFLKKNSVIFPQSSQYFLFLPPWLKGVFWRLQKWPAKSPIFFLGASCQVAVAFCVKIISNPKTKFSHYLPGVRGFWAKDLSAQCAKRFLSSTRKPRAPSLPGGGRIEEIR